MSICDSRLSIRVSRLSSCVSRLSSCVSQWSICVWRLSICVSLLIHRLATRRSYVSYSNYNKILSSGVTWKVFSPIIMLKSGFLWLVLSSIAMLFSGFMTIFYLIQHSSSILKTVWVCPLYSRVWANVLQTVFYYHTGSSLLWLHPLGYECSNWTIDNG